MERHNSIATKKAEYSLYSRERSNRDWYAQGESEGDGETGFGAKV